MKDPLQQTIKELSESFEQFSRNGRWGTCAACPRDNHGKYYPEFCQFTDRYDHQLDIDSLADTWKRYLKFNSK